MDKGLILSIVGVAIMGSITFYLSIREIFLWIASWFYVDDYEED